MKKTLLTLLGLFLLANGVNSQEQRVFDPTNARDGEQVEYCLTHKIHAANMNDPVYAAEYLQNQIDLQNPSQLEEPEATTYYIPVVFHLLHNNGIEKISDEQIMDALDILNRDYDLLNPDAANVHWDFNASNPAATSIPSDVDIQFRLATIAPNGACFKGITYTKSSASYSGNGLTQLNAIKNGNDVYNGEWPGNRYLNVFICGDIGGAAGYTNYPSSNTSMSNGIYVLHSYVGSIGTSSPGTSRTLTHETGHWLNLPHLWGNSNNPGEAGNCGEDDGVSDTPTCMGLTACNLNANTCDDDNAFWGFDMRDNTENYMEYSYCSKMFTPGQVTRMRNAMNSALGGRSNIKSAANLALVGAEGTMTLCRAEFDATKTTICAGESVQFNDLTFNAANGWSWTFTGGSPSSSTVQDPVVTYSTPGLYEVSLTATDGPNSDVETKSAYIRVLPAAASLPFLETFEYISTFTGNLDWEVIDEGNNAKFAITSDASHTGVKSAKLANYGQAVGNVDELVSAPVDLSGITSQNAMTLSFRYAYRLRSAGNVEYLKVFASSTCGDTWVQRKTIFGTSLSDQVVNTSWTPASPSEWTTVHMANITSSYWVDNFRYKFRFESDGGNNFFLDNINIYAGSESDAVIVGLEESEAVENLALYPNPADDELNVKFSVNDAQKLVFSIQDVSGKVLQSTLIQANAGSNLVMFDTNDLASGMYFLTMTSGGTQRVLQFIVK